MMSAMDAAEDMMDAVAEDRCKWTKTDADAANKDGCGCGCGCGGRETLTLDVVDENDDNGCGHQKIMMPFGQKIMTTMQAMDGITRCPSLLFIQPANDQRILQATAGHKTAVILSAGK